MTYGGSGFSAPSMRTARTAFPLPPYPQVDFSNELRENAALARMSNEAPRIPWEVFIRDHLQWQPGEHFALIGPTGQGKTNMMINLLPLHPYVTVFATKPRDTTMDHLLENGYVKLERWRSLDPRDFPRRVLWPDASAVDSIDRQKVVFEHAFERIFREGGWTLAIDELWYIVNMLKLDKYVRLYLLQARSLGVSLLLATQRPAFVPLEVYDQSTHLMFYRDNDERNLSRLSGISYRSADLIRQLVSGLERFQVLYINTRTGKMLRTRSPKVTVKGGTT